MHYAGNGTLTNDPGHFIQSGISILFLFAIQLASVFWRCGDVVIQARSEDRSAGTLWRRTTDIWRRDRLDLELIRTNRTSRFRKIRFRLEELGVRSHHGVCSGTIAD